MNADTRVLSTKALQDLPGPDDLRRRLLEPPEIAQMREQTERHPYDLLTKDTKRRRKSTAPIRIASFEVD